MRLERGKNRFHILGSYVCFRSYCSFGNSKFSKLREGASWHFSKEKRNAKIDELTDLLGLESILRRKAGKLSGGWQRRLSIAMALISEPQILFLDEPTLGLDVLARSDLWEIIKSLKGKITIILTTHYMQEAEALSDRIAIMKDGKLLICDTAEKIKETAGTDNFEEAFVRIARGVRE